MNPYYLKETAKGELAVPCGKCPACAARRASAWSFRLMQEEKQSNSAHFITLTYDTSTVPITGNRFLTLRKDDVQKFFKRLRKAMPAGSKPIKYYCVGEYGGKTNRPHYHAIIFNAELPLIQPAWQLGQIHYGTVSGASIGYTLKYISKQKRIPMHQNDDRIPEFALMSKGLGKSYITLETYHWHNTPAKQAERMYLNIEDGKKISMPRYYKQKIYSEQERKIIGAKTRINMEKQQERKDLLSPPNEWDNDQNKLAAYKNMYKNADKGNKI